MPVSSGLRPAASGRHASSEATASPLDRSSWASDRCAQPSRLRWSPAGRPRPTHSCHPPRQIGRRIPDVRAVDQRSSSFGPSLSFGQSISSSHSKLSARAVLCPLAVEAQSRLAMPRLGPAVLGSVVRFPYPLLSQLVHEAEAKNSQHDAQQQGQRSYTAFECRVISVRVERDVVEIDFVHFVEAKHLCRLVHRRARGVQQSRWAGCHDHARRTDLSGARVPSGLTSDRPRAASTRRPYRWKRRARLRPTQGCCQMRPDQERYVSGQPNRCVAAFLSIFSSHRMARTVDVTPFG